VPDNAAPKETDHGHATTNLQNGEHQHNESHEVQDTVIQAGQQDTIVRLCK